MPGYELKDAKFLLTYYEGKLIGQKIDPKLSQKILMLGMEGDSEYELFAYAKSAPETGVEKRNIAAIASDLALPSPDEVLKKRQ